MKGSARSTFEAPVLASGDKFEATAHFIIAPLSVSLFVCASQYAVRVCVSKPLSLLASHFEPFNSQSVCFSICVSAIVNDIDTAYLKIRHKLPRFSTYRCS